MKRKTDLYILPAAVTMLVLILDSKTASEGMSEGISLCLRVVIPALFPTMLTSVLLLRYLPGIKLPKFLSQLLGLQPGEETLFLTGILAGYPVGAAMAAEAFRAGSITRERACRTLSFCNNAGPAFIFGMGSVLFTSPLSPLTAWLIQIASAILVAATAKRSKDTDKYIHPQAVSGDMLGTCIKKMALICGWVTIFKVILTFAEKWILWCLPDPLMAVASGTLELTNGICALSKVDAEWLRFLIFNILLAFGGLCVHMQTAAVCESLPTKPHLFGKLRQTAFAALLAVICCRLQYGSETDASVLLIVAALSVLLIIFQKTMEIYGQVIYNRQKRRRGTEYAVS